MDYVGVSETSGEHIGSPLQSVDKAIESKKTSHRERSFLQTLLTANVFELSCVLTVFSFTLYFY
jgi:hypothetical protein